MTQFLKNFEPNETRRYDIIYVLIPCHIYSLLDITMYVDRNFETVMGLDMAIRMV